MLNAKNLSDDDIKRQWVINSLMCRQSLDRRLFQEHFQEEFDPLFGKELQKLTEFIKGGYLDDDGRCLIVKNSGRLLLRNICSVFDAYYRKKNRTFSQAI